MVSSGFLRQVARGRNKLRNIPKDTNLNHLKICLILKEMNTAYSSPFDMQANS
jgi:hypothetical protein